MLKLRWMGTPDELIWFRRHLEEDQNLRLQNVSHILPIRTSNRHFRMMRRYILQILQKAAARNRKSRKKYKDR